MFDFLGLPNEEELPIESEIEQKRRWQNRRQKTLLFAPKKSEEEVDHLLSTRRKPRKPPKKPVVKMIMDSSASAIVRMRISTKSEFFRPYKNIFCRNKEKQK